MRQQPLVIYHGKCYDGFTAAWVFRKFRGEAEFVGVNYGDTTHPDCKGRDVWMIDFSYPREIMKEIIVQSMTTTVLDHHKTAEHELNGIQTEIRMEKKVQRESDRIIFDMTRSGAGMIFDFLEDEISRKRGLKPPRFNGQRAEWLVDYVEDRDLWRNKLFRSREVNAWISAVPMTFEDWDSLSALTIADAASRGDNVLAYQKQYGEKVLVSARTEKLGLHDVPAVNLQYVNCSEYLGLLAERNPDAPFVVGYFRRADGKWQFSLRSRGEFDVSDVAKQFGGGGHKNAAGFGMATFPWV